MKEIGCGKMVCGGNVMGTIINITDEVKYQSINPDHIVVLKNSDPVNALYIMHAGGVIIRNGGILAHSCLLAMEMGKPCITQIGNDLCLSDGTKVILNATEGVIYEL